MRVQWEMWLMQYGKRAIGQGAETEDKSLAPQGGN
jgi:hypothetical protein